MRDGAKSATVLNMDSKLTIGQLCAATGVPTSALRYYERTKLLVPSGRTDGNYRIYDATAVQRVRFIRIAQSAGFSLEDIASLLEVRDGVTAPCEDVELLITNRLKEVKDRLSDLNEVERHLSDFLDTCKSSSNKQQCEVLDTLTLESFKSIL